VAGSVARAAARGRTPKQVAILDFLGPHFRLERGLTCNGMGAVPPWAAWAEIEKSDRHHADEVWADTSASTPYRDHRCQRKPRGIAFPKLVSNALAGCAASLSIWAGT
jgi:hypothetical protein